MQHWSANDFAKKVITYYQNYGRKNLPWHKNVNAYRVWLSEVMLQQTQVATVIPYYQKFLQHFPTIHDLAAADNELVMQLWSGLGYYSRARNLHKAAKMVVDEFAGEFPKSVELLEKLPGVGRSTAGAIASFAYQQSSPILDGNVKRVLARCYAIEGWAGNGQVLKKLWSRAEKNTPTHNTAHYNQAMMDLGALVCKRSNPLCQDCPLSKKCIAYQTDTIANFPVKKPKKERPSKYIYWLIHLERGKVLLEKRPPSGIWGGLWSLPEIEQSENAPQHQQELPPILHKFSHYDLHISPLIAEKNPQINSENTQKLGKIAHIREDRPYQWVDLQQIENIGLPAPLNKLLNTLELSR